MNGIAISPFYNSTEIPPLDCQAAARYITPGGGAAMPTPQEVYDIVRVWGSIRLINLVVVGSGWSCRIEWWYEDEAHRFQCNFKRAGSSLKGHQV